jgi:hypothetical protein
MRTLLTILALVCSSSTLADILSSGGAPSLTGVTAPTQISQTNCVTKRVYHTRRTCTATRWGKDSQKITCALANNAPEVRQLCPVGKYLQSAGNDTTYQYAWTSKTITANIYYSYTCCMP